MHLCYRDLYTLVFQETPFISAHPQPDAPLLSKIIFCSLKDLCRVIDFKSFHYFILQVQARNRLHSCLCLKETPSAFGPVIPLTGFIACTGIDQRHWLLHSVLCITEKIEGNRCDADIVIVL